MCIRDRLLADQDTALAPRQIGTGLIDHGELDTRERQGAGTVSYTHLRAHETVLDLVCRLLLEKKNKTATLR